VAGQDARGRYYFAGAYDAPVRRLDPTGGGHLEVLPRGTVDGVSVDAHGQIYEVAGGKLSTRDPDGGAATQLLSVLPPDSATNGYAFNLRMFFAKGVARTPDGAAYIGQQYLLYRVKDDKIALAAGSQGATSGGAADVAIQEPSGVAVAADGALLVADSGNHRLLRVGPDQKVTVLAGSGQHFNGPRTGDALKVGFSGPYNVHVDAAGTIYLADLGLFKLAGGQLTQVYVADGASITGFAAAADGTLYFCETGIAGLKLQRLAPGATTPETLAAEPNRHMPYSLAVDGAGTLYLMGNGTLRTWTRAAGFATVGTDARFKDGYQELAVDARGRCYFTEGFSSLHVQRYDPASQAFTVVAGTGSSHFAGTGVDQSVASAVSPTFDAAGDLYFGDFGHRQVKRIPASEL
jgi:sugar lactone lactonase YvrE